MCKLIMARPRVPVTVIQQQTIFLAHDLCLIKHPAVDHLLGKKMQLALIGDGDSGGLEVR